MKEKSLSQLNPNSVAFIGNYLPRRCGIATFTTDLLESIEGEAPEIECRAVVMNDEIDTYSYPPQVRFELNYKNPEDYRLAADFLNMNQVEIVSFQHEFGIFGGKNGRHILELIQKLRMPVVTTLHTVLKEPDEHQKITIQRICRASDRMVVLNNRAIKILHDVYDLPEEKILFIPHGIPDVSFIDPNFYKDQFDVEGRKVILTFGLLSMDKGLEYVIDALPKIVQKYKDVVYIILGATHPHVKKAYGESYRYSLQQRARELGVENHLIFHNRFVDFKELCEFLGAADIYVTPYLKREQAVSGTLAYALGSGKAIISTPYWYAEEMLADGRGRIVPFKNSEAIADQVIDLLDNENERHVMRKKAYTFCRNMIWKEVANRYVEVFLEVKNEREHRPVPNVYNKTIDVISLDLPQVKLAHFKILTDDVGIIQHAKFIIPDRSFGYSTDDIARALIVAILAQDFVIEWDGQLMELTCRYLGFLHHAFNEKNGRFHNFLSYDRSWLDEMGSEDCHGRALWGIGTVLAFSRSENLTESAQYIFERALPVITEFQSPRAWAFGLIGINAYLKRFGGDSEVKRVQMTLVNQLLSLYHSNASEDWPWIENSLTYDNGKIPHALIHAGHWLQREDMISTGLNSLEWLMNIQTDRRGHFVPVGNHGWFSRDGQRARFDQQPIEAQSMIDACLDAYHVTGDKKWIQKAHLCFDWFLGRNDLNVPLYDYQTGGCSDGLTADGPNRNQGAESTLAWLLSLLNLHALVAEKPIT